MDSVAAEIQTQEDTSVAENGKQAERLLREIEDRHMFLLASEPTEMQILLRACAAGQDQQLRSLLQEERYITAALSYKKRHPYLPEFVTLSFMFEAATGVNSASLVLYLLGFAQQHGVALDELIMRWSLLRALATGNLDILRAYVEAMPSCVNMSFSHAGDPLLQASSIMKYTDEGTTLALIEYLLDKGADPNRAPCQWFMRPGRHLYGAAQSSSVDVLALLLRYGARIKGSGAVVRAAECGRVDALEVLREYGADLKEPRGPDIWLCHDPSERQQRAEETPVEAARREGKENAVDWLTQNGGG